MAWCTNASQFAHPSMLAGEFHYSLLSGVKDICFRHITKLAVAQTKMALCKELRLLQTQGLDSYAKKSDEKKQKMNNTKQ